MKSALKGLSIALLLLSSEFVLSDQGKWKIVYTRTFEDELFEYSREYGEKILSYIEEIGINPYEVSQGNLKGLSGPLQGRLRLKLDKGGRFIYRTDSTQKKIFLESCNRDHYESFQKAVENGSADQRKEIELDQTKLEEWKNAVTEWNNERQKPEQGIKEAKEAIIRGTIEEVKKLINKRNVNTVNPKNGKTLLMYAAENGRFDVLQHLIEKGGDVNREDDDGKSVLMYALDGIEKTEEANEKRGIIDLLLEQGVNVNAKDKAQITALMIATQYGQYENVKKLIKKKAKVNERNKRGETALMFAVEGGSEKIIRYLIQKGADVNIRNAKHQTAEMIAIDMLEKIRNRRKRSVEAEELITKIIKILKKQAESTKSDTEKGSSDDLSSQSSIEIVLEDDLAEDSDDSKDELLPEDLKEATIVFDKNELSSEKWFEDAKYGDKEEIRAYLDAEFDINTIDEQGKTALMYAVENNNKAAAKLLLQAGADINKQDKDGKTALMYAAENENSSSVAVLLKNNPKIDITNKEGKTVFDIAEEKNWNDGLGVLNAYKTIQKQREETVSWQAEESEKNRLFESIESGKYYEIKQYLSENINILDQKDSKNRTILMYIANFIKEKETCNDLLGVLLFLNKTVNKQVKQKIKDKVNEQDIDGKTTLMYAVENDNKVAIERLLQAGADINKQDKDGKTALMYAAENKNQSLVEVLLKNNPKIDITNKEENTVFDIAKDKNWNQGLGVLNAYKKMQQKQKEETVSWQAEEPEKNKLFESIESEKYNEIKRLLYKSGSILDKKDSKNRTILMYIANFIKNQVACNNLFDALLSLNKTVKKQVKQKVKDKVNEQDIYGKTALMYAVENDNRIAAKLLLKAGADINKQDKDGKTTLMYAAENNNKAVVERLLKAGADINKQDNDGKTALMYAVENDNRTAAKLLLQAGADINKQDNDGKTALMYAAENKNHPLADMLLKNNPKIDITNKEGNTAEGKNWKMGIGLLKEPVSWQAKESKESTLFKSIESGKYDKIKPFLKIENVLDQKDSKNRTTLMYIANFIKNTKICGNLFTTLLSLSKTVNKQVKQKIKDKVNEQDIDGKTALIYAVENDNKVAAKLLLKAGADINKQDKDGKTALMYAAKNENLSLVDVLLKNNPKIDITNKEENTAVDIAKEKKWKEGLSVLNAYKESQKQKEETVSFQSE